MCVRTVISWIVCTRALHEQLPFWWELSVLKGVLSGHSVETDMLKSENYPPERDPKIKKNNFRSRTSTNIHYHSFDTCHSSARLLLTLQFSRCFLFASWTALALTHQLCTGNVFNFSLFLLHSTRREKTPKWACVRLKMWINSVAGIVYFSFPHTWQNTLALFPCVNMKRPTN